MARQIRIDVIFGKALGVDVVRGHARLCDLSLISRADVYDPKSNPTGTQRDLSPKHARDAYNYVKADSLAFWPEILLCVRDPSVISLRSKKGESCGVLTVDLDALTRKKKIAISRLDGNHRLHYADGRSAGYPPIEDLVPFSLALNLDIDKEIKLFRDINNNQRKMSTSHLDNITVRLTAEEQLKLDQPALYVAQKLGKDPKSPFYRRIYDGGAKAHGNSLVPLRTLKSGIEYLFSKVVRLGALPDVDAKYAVIRNYFSAVKLWAPEPWSEPSKYLMLRGVGLWSISFLGAHVIDRALNNGQFLPEEMLSILESGKRWDWSSKGDFRGLSGRGGALKISETIAQELSGPENLSLRDLYGKIMSDV